jgi:hypothetical protein
MKKVLKVVRKYDLVAPTVKDHLHFDGDEK